jgi:hypothetical protein
MYCPLCRDGGSPTIELMRDNVDMFCLMGHKLPHARMQSLNPDMIKTEIRFKPGANDVKVEVWVNREVLAKTQDVLGERWHPTIASLIRCCAAGDPVIIDGQQAAELRKLGVRNGQEMLATAKLNRDISSQNEDLVAKVNEWEDRFKSALQSV